MLAALVGGWGDSLRRDLEAVRGHHAWRAAGITGIALLIAGAGLLGTRVARAFAAGRVAVAFDRGAAQPMDVELPALALIDQYGRRASLADVRGHSTLLTFAFGHCAVVCPTIVHDIMTTRETTGRTDVPLLVITLDPWRDTPERLSTMAQSWQLAPGDRVLSGSVADVQQVLDQLGIGRRRNETTGDIEHAPTAMLVDARGRIRYRFEGGLGHLRDLLQTTPQ
jgi:protein SCO1